MKIIIVGGAGYIGSVISKKLYNDGHDTHILDRNIFLENVEHCNKFTKIDIRDVEDKIFKGADIVFDYSGISNDPSGDISENLTTDINITGRSKIAECAKQAGVKRYVFASTCSVYGAVMSKKPVNETHEVSPLTAYASSAAQMEKKLLDMSSSKFKVLCIRHGTVYGFSPKMRLDLVVNLMCKNAIENGRIFITGGGYQRRPLLSLRTIAQFLSEVSKREENFISEGNFDIVNLAEGNVQMNELAHRLSHFVKEYLGKNVETVVVPDDNDKRDYSVSIDKLKSFYAFSPDYLEKEVLVELIEGLQTLDFTDARYVTQKWYSYILGFEESVEQVGKLSR